MKAEAFPISVHPPPFFRDHHVQDRPVLPAVEAMEQLAADTCGRFPETDGRCLSDLRFDRFLHLDEPTPVAATNRVGKNDDGSLRAALTTRIQSKKTGIGRSLEHASLTVGQARSMDKALSLEVAASLAGVCTTVTPERIYADMVPFGPAYRNICSDLLLSADGALARVRSPQPPDPRGNLYLGSPYVLDAAFHAACVWCQRYLDNVAFPVSIDQRTVFRPTRLEAVYTARIVPVQTEKEPFLFDTFIYDDNAGLCESAIGVGMRDVSGGRTRPPHGFFEPAGTDPLRSLADRVAGLVLLERKAVAPFAPAALSEREKRRLEPMTEQRAGAYLSARLALKRLSRMLGGGEDRREARQIETVAEDGRRPMCPQPDGSRTFCSVAHDRRFTLAAAAGKPLGVDVEPLADKPLAATHLYLDAEEKALIKQSSLAPARAALQAWSAKEAAAKALGIDLAQAWERVRVTLLSEKESRLETDAGRWLTAVHATVEGHLFTLLTEGENP
ncbi:4'-phosphopantetheinyl transferase superfamily protein [uncultured Desulfosarcina sp.]|uniref:4'-phosphopantetheinyl transferase superfamily protein n=1 Tax=uncultured Desulfosarcina sp. TaxID=218289 RepID=UPI0029C8AFF8|nr:4'-phosphopantetheinyl transferase superfamily protein [uncultured Desulfosarcina sp.]